MSFPRDLRLLSHEQAEFCVAFYAARPLDDIRRRQDLTAQQIGWAFEQRNDFALANLRVREELLRLAAERKLLAPPCIAAFHHEHR
ncbi:MAG TPA: hypothetical protein VJ783_10755 [Pirellulales bacterium]|nr:hypothetical protein [Pirellulales bacterium]